MLLSTTPEINEKKTIETLGIVNGDAIMGANIFRDLFAGIRDVVGGRSAAYEKELKSAKDIATGEMIKMAEELGANAIVGIDLDYETVGQSMLMVSISGTAIKVE